MAHGAAAGLSGPAALVLLLPMEAGVPVPLPADLVRRRSRGAWAAWMEASCPVCVGVTLLASLSGFATADTADTAAGGVACHG